MLFARILNLDYLNNVDENQLDLSENDVEKNISNLSLTVKDDSINLRWADCINPYWKKAYIVRGENSIPTSVYNGSIVGTYHEKNKYSTTDFIDSDILPDTLYCYRIFTEFSNEPEYYSGLKNIFYVYVGGNMDNTENKIKRYSVDKDGDCFVVATGEGVKMEKEGSNVTLNVPENVTLLSAQIRFSGEEIGTGSKCSIKYGNDFNYEDNLCVPNYQVIFDNEGSRSYKVAPFPYGNVNSDQGNTLELTSLPANQPVIVKLTF